MGRKQLYVVEARHPDGSLNVKENTPFNVSGVDEDTLFQYFFRNHPDRDGADWNDLGVYFASKGWHIRRKTW